MSEAVVTGSARAAVAPIALVGGAIASAGHAMYQGLAWLSRQEMQAFKRLEEELRTTMPTHVTTTEERKRFQKEFRRAKNAAAKHPVLRHHQEAIGRSIALQHSSFGQLLSKEDWNTVTHPNASNESCARIAKRAAQRFTIANAKRCADALRASAITAGFPHSARNEVHGDLSIIVMSDDSGRSMVGKIRPGEEGAQVSIDLTGFHDRSCHTAMDRMLEGLAKQGIHLDRIKRMSHYHPEGLVAKTPRVGTSRSKAAKPSVSTASQTKKDDRRRRQLHNQRSIQNIC